MSEITKNIVFDGVSPTQTTFMLEKSFADEIERAKDFIKNRFIENNKSYLEDKNYSVKVDGFIIDEQLYVGQIKFQIRLVDSNKEDVTIKEFLNLK